MLKHKFASLFALTALLGFAAAPTLAQEGETGGTGYYCENPSDPHPVAAGIAERFNVPYDEVLGHFCDGTINGNGRYGLGEIGLAYQTAETLADGTTAEELLAMKSELGGWGKVWQSYGLIGKPDHAGPPEDKGKPENPGPPDHANPGGKKQP